MKTTNRPWLKADGIEYCVTELKKMSRSWDAQTWENYLSWFERPLKEHRLHPLAYDLACEARSETIYQEYGYETDEVLAEYCKELLQTIPEQEREVLKLYFFEGLLENQIAPRLKISQQYVSRLKLRAISRLKRENKASAVVPIHIMRGLVSKTPAESPSIWKSESITAESIRERRTYDPDEWKAELAAIKNATVKRAVEDLPELSQRIVYLRFWCDLSAGAIARRLGIGTDSLAAICDAAVFKIKSHAVFELTNSKEVQS